MNKPIFTYVRHAGLALALLCVTAVSGAAQTLPSRVAAAQPLGRVSGDATVSLTLTLPLRRQAELDDLLRGLSDPSDPQYGKFLTPAQFTARFGPTPADYAAVQDWARARGLVVTGTHPNRLLLDVSGTAGAVESAFRVRLGQYRAADGRIFRVPNAAPRIPAAMAARVSGVVGLDTGAVRRPRLQRLSAAELSPLAQPAAIGSGPRGGLSPSDIRAAYNLSNTPLDGAGQTLAVFELADYDPNDIAAYASAFHLANPSRQNILVDGGSDEPASGSDEATLDLELQIALAPGARKILVYEGPNSDTGILHTYNRIATDNQAQQISTSWGLEESQSGQSVLNGENAIFQQMAAQGQTIYAAAGDNGAFDDGTNLSVDDPASQPFVCGVGGTSLATTGPGGLWAGETTWNNGSAAAGAGGGGISRVWPLPAYQQGIISPASGGSGTMRNVPDVSLDANPQTGYAIYYGGGWHVYGGVSCAAPLWAGFTALVNQQRQASGVGLLGQANPAIYRIGASANYGQCFHDVADNSNNLVYPAVGGYDLATGWGSYNGAFLLAALASSAAGGGAVTGGQFPAGLNFFSLPYDYTGVPLDSLFGYGGVHLAVWQPDLLQYVLTPTAPADQIQLGRGYWVRFPGSVSVTTLGASANSQVAFPIGLGTGWNSIGDPFAASVPISSLQVVADGQGRAFGDAAGAGLIGATLYWYDQSKNNYASITASGALQPGRGYWVHASRPVTLLVPPP